MQVITCTGFYGTGSSAITDVLMDCDVVECKGDYEIRILHDPYGVSDLEYNLVENPNRHNTSNAIKKFKWNIDFLSGNWWIKRYESYFDGKFKELSYQYIDNISKFSYRGKWHWDIIERGKTFWFINRSYNKLFVILKRIFHLENDVSHDFLPKNEMAYAGIQNEEEFLKYTRLYTNQLLNAINKNKKEFLCVDQLVPPSNFVRYSKYVDNLKIIVVDRDPRDIFLLEKMVWHGTVVPCYDVEKFCDWFEWTRSMYECSEKPDNLLKIQFEDLVYDTKHTIGLLLEFTGISPESYHLNHFDPQKSVLNTQLWKKYSGFDSEMNYIAKRLAKYCYDY